MQAKGNAAAQRGGCSTTAPAITTTPPTPSAGPTTTTSPKGPRLSKLSELMAQIDKCKKLQGEVTATIQTYQKTQNAKPDEPAPDDDVVVAETPSTPTTTADNNNNSSSSKNLSPKISKHKPSPKNSKRDVAQQGSPARSRITPTKTTAVKVPVPTKAKRAQAQQTSKQGRVSPTAQPDEPASNTVVEPTSALVEEQPAAGPVDEEPDSRVDVENILIDDDAVASNGIASSSHDAAPTANGNVAGDDDGSSSGDSSVPAIVPLNDTLELAPKIEDDPLLHARTSSTSSDDNSNDDDDNENNNNNSNNNNNNNNNNYKHDDRNKNSESFAQTTKRSEGPSMHAPSKPAPTNAPLSLPAPKPTPTACAKTEEVFFSIARSDGDTLTLAWDPSHALPDNTMFSLLAVSADGQRVKELASALQAREVTIPNPAANSSATPPRLVLSAKVVLDVPSAPLVPGNVRVSDVGQHFIDIAWNNNGHSQNSEFLVQVLREGSSDWEEHVVPNSKNQFQTAGLGPGQLTKFCVRSRHIATPHITSAPGTTEATTLPEPPEQVVVKKLDTRGATIAWTVPKGATVFGVVVRAQGSSSKLFDKQDIGLGNATADANGKMWVEVDIPSLRPGTCYDAALYAGNKHGFEEIGCDLEFGALPSPAQLSFTLTSATSCEVGWPGVRAANQYRVEMRQSNTGDEAWSVVPGEDGSQLCTLRTEPGEAGKCTLTDLRVGQSYDVRVFSGNNNVFETSGRTATHAHTFPSPGNLRATFLSSSEARLAWDPAPGSTATNTYRTEMRCSPSPTDDECDHDAFEVVSTPTSANQETITLRRLRTGHPYEVRVVAKDRATGVESPPALLSFCPVGSVMSLQVSDVTPEGAVVSWTAPSPSAACYMLELRVGHTDAANGSGDEEGATATTGSGQGFNVVSRTIQDTRFKLELLDASTPYTVRVRAGAPTLANEGEMSFETVGCEATFTTSDFDPRTLSDLLKVILVGVKDDKVSIRWKAVPEVMRYQISTICLDDLDPQKASSKAKRAIANAAEATTPTKDNNYNSAAVGSARPQWVSVPRMSPLALSEVVLIAGFSKQTSQFVIRVDAIRQNKDTAEEVIHASDELYVLPRVESTAQLHGAFVDQIRRMKARCHIEALISVDTIDEGSHYLVAGLTCHVRCDRTIVVRVGGGYQYLSLWFQRLIVPLVSKMEDQGTPLVSPRTPRSSSRSSVSTTPGLKRRMSDFEMMKERQISRSRVVV